MSLTFSVGNLIIFLSKQIVENCDIAILPNAKRQNENKVITKSDTLY